MIFQLDRQVGKDVNPIRFSYCKRQKKALVVAGNLAQ